MGYQESIIKVKDEDAFDVVVRYLRDHSEELEVLIDLATVVIFKEDLTMKRGLIRRIKFNTDERSICITGERSGHDKEFIFKWDRALSNKCSIHAIEEFQNINGKFVDMEVLNKMFVTHEICSEIPFKDYEEGVQYNFIQE